MSDTNWLILAGGLVGIIGWVTGYIMGSRR
jgi:hypothetical protein